MPAQQANLEGMIRRAKEDYHDHVALTVLVKVLEASLERDAYHLFAREFGPEATFYDDEAESGGIVDREGTKEAHYPKYCLFKFASFLDLLCPGKVHWRGQADPRSMSWVRRGLNRFQAADRHGRSAMLSRWIRQPGRTAFSEEKMEQSQHILRRREFLLSLPNNLAAPLVAGRLDEGGFKPGRKYPSYAEWCSKNLNSFASWLSRERATAKRQLGEAPERPPRKISKLS